MSSIPQRSPGKHRRPATPVRLTRRGRIVRDLVGGAGILGLAVFAQPISVGFFTAVLWAGQLAGVQA